MKFATLNFRGLNGDSGLSKRQHLMKIMESERYDVVLLSETQVSSSSHETHRDFLFFLSSDVPHDKADRENAGVGIVFHKKLLPCIHEIRQVSGRVMLVRFRAYGSNLAVHTPHTVDIPILKMLSTTPFKIV